MSVRPLHPLKGNQRRASDPARHVWLSASAGTGKTQVLAARVWRLLLAGVDPGAILCLTFTKAGASEMSERITSRLARWVRASDKELVDDLDALGESISPEGRARARTLFAKVLDAPGGGIRIQTIHSFCQSLLSAFPVEAGLVPGFRPLDQREEAVLVREALAEMLIDAGREGRTGLIDAVGALSLRLGEGKAEAFLKMCASNAEAMRTVGASGVARLEIRYRGGGTLGTARRSHPAATITRISLPCLRTFRPSSGNGSSCGDSALCVLELRVPVARGQCPYAPIPSLVLLGASSPARRRGGEEWKVM